MKKANLLCLCVCILCLQWMYGCRGAPCLIEWKQMCTGKLLLCVFNVMCPWHNIRKSILRSIIKETFQMELGIGKQKLKMTF